MSPNGTLRVDELETVPTRHSDAPVRLAPTVEQTDREHGRHAEHQRRERGDLIVAGLDDRQQFHRQRPHQSASDEERERQLAPRDQSAQNEPLTEPATEQRHDDPRQHLPP